MTRNLLIVSICMLCSVFVSAQNMMEWTADRPLRVEDFEAPAPNSDQMQSASGSFSVSYEFGGLSLITTRNLNAFVHCNFQKDASYFDNADEIATQRMLAYQQLIFDVYELEARNVRKRFFEERSRLLTKGPGVIYQEVAAEHARLLSRVEEETFHGSNADEIARLANWVSNEMDKLSDYCIDCKPEKKRKKD